MMRALFVPAFALTFVGLILGSGQGSATTESPLRGDPARGRRVFVKKKCVDCHAVLGSGGKVGPDLTGVGSGRSFFTLLGQLWDHSPRMIESMGGKGFRWPRMSETQMSDLVSYLYYLNYFDQPGDYKRGKKAFKEKACVRCHSIGGDGGSVGPPLDAYASAASPVKMLTAMWNHGPAMVRRFRMLGMKPASFKGSETADILAYLRATTTRPHTRTEYLSPGDPRAGRKVFEQKKCASCHPVRGVGKGKDIDLAKANLNRSVSEIAGVLWNHGPIIWEKLKDLKVAVQPFTPQQMTDLVAYLYFIRYYPPDGDLEKGKKLFHDRGCHDCHSQSADTKHRGPVLARMRSVKDPISFATALWNHAPDMFEATKDKLLPWPRLTGPEMRDLAAYLRQSKPKKK